MNEIGLTVADLSAKLGLDSSGFDRGMSGILGKFGSLSPVAMAGGLAIAGGLALGVKALFDLGAAWDDAFDNMRIGTGKTGAALEGLQDDFKAVFSTTPVGMQEVSVAITEVNRRLSITGPELQKVTRSFLELSRVTKTDVAENIRLGTRLFGDWSISTANQGKTLDLLFRATQQSGIGLTDLMTTVVQFGAPLRNMGFGFAESVAMLSKWEKEGVNTSTVLTGMKFALKTFAAAGKEPQAALEGTIKKIRDMDDAQKAMSLGMKTFGLRAGPDMVAAIREGRFEYDKFEKTLKRGKDTVAKAAKATDDWRESLTLLKNRGFVAAEPASSSFFDTVGKGAKKLTKVIDSPAFGAAVKAILKMQSGLDAAMGKVVRVFFDGWSAVKDITRENVEAVRAIVGGALGRIRSAVSGAMSAVRGAISSAWSAARSATSTAWSSINSITQGGASRVVGIVGGLPGRVAGALGSLGGMLYGAGASLIQGLIDGVTDRLDILWDTVSSIAGRIRALKGPPSYDAVLLTPAGTSIMQGLINGIEAQRGSLTSTMRGVTADLASGVSGARFPALAVAGGHGAAPTRGGAPVAAGGGSSFTFGSVSIILPPGDYGDSEDAGSAAADAFMQRTREIARGY